MSFQPVLPLGGLPGWAFLNRTLDRQQAAFASSATVQRATDYFRANIGRATSAEVLTGDRRLLEVALGAFGLEDDITARAFIRKVLEEGTTREGALSSRLGDKRYAGLARAFGYGDPGTSVGPGAQLDPDRYADDIIARMASGGLGTADGKTADGEGDNNLHLALELKPALADLLDNTAGERARWYALLANPSLRQLFETALDLPPSAGQPGSHGEVIAFMDAARAAFGTDDLAAFASAPRAEALIRRFLVRAHDTTTSLSQHPVQRDSFVAEIIARFEARQFEAAVGEQDNDLRLALNLKPALDELLGATTGDRARWFAVMGNPPLRNLFETALGLPSSLGRLDIDRQLSIFMDKTKAAFGTNNLADFAQDELREALTRRFLVRSEAAAFSNSQTSASIAMALLSSAGRMTFAP